MTDRDAAVERLTRRLDRERRARKEAERIAEAGMRALYEANASLDQRIRDRTRELEEATRAAESASAARGAFLAHLSHEMRTPLNGINGMLELLAQEVVAEPAVSWLDSARTSADRLERLLTRTLRIVELESAPLADLAEFADVEAILRDTEARWRRRCAEAGQLLVTDIETPTGCGVHTTPEIALALDELLHNAVTHGSPGRVVLRSHTDGTTVWLSVIDPGPKRAFEGPDEIEVLRPGGSTITRTSQGAGMGLALVSRFAQALGGGAGLDADSEGGTRGWFALPAAVATISPDLLDG